jgi:hypothetical protein
MLKRKHVILAPEEGIAYRGYAAFMSDARAPFNQLARF